MAADPAGQGCGPSAPQKPYGDRPDWRTSHRIPRQCHSTVGRHWPIRLCRSSWSAH